MIGVTQCRTKFGLKSVEICIAQGKDNLLFKAVRNFLNHLWRSEAALYGGYICRAFGGAGSGIWRKKESDLQHVIESFIKQRTAMTLFENDGMKTMGSETTLLLSNDSSS